ncbi:glycosyl hydrolase [Lacihabitans sp. CS3-21]|uniref:glycosyl hydrolase n=1 Tax=Lacihabitans sp. CS3-21 TaxID=2487332 RepID=UPI0020CEE764|nr:glycosyl hydrolase [Lacihabitans sp. CS3-21]MCP9747781.1 glycoside hydrolase [Lacihabitans sp. CS3-21]
MKKIFIGLLLLQSQLMAQSTLLEDFQTPPNAAKPRVWWHWMNGNISKEGIQKDLDWMKNTGIGGFQNFDANLFTPLVVPKKLVFMDPDWKDAFKFTTDMAVKNGLEMAIAGSPGWSVTGGPWVEPKDAMKKIVWSEVLIKGGEIFNGKLPVLPNNIGKYQEVPESGGGISGGFVGIKPEFAADAFVIAYKLSDNEKHLPQMNPKITVSGGDFDVKGLLDHDIKTFYAIPPMEVGQDMYVQYSFDEPQTFRAFAVSGASQDPLAEFNGAPENRSLKVSDDGINWRTVGKVSGSTVPFNTVSIPTTTAKYWRMCFQTLPITVSPMLAMMGAPAPTKPDGVNVAEFVLFNTSRINQSEDKAGFSPWKEDSEYGDLSFKIEIPDIIGSQNIVDLTSKVGADGSLNWTVPKGGEWIILRLGYSLTGRQNHPASPEATGLEVDKLDKEAVKKYINTYLDLYKDATGGQLGAKGLEYMALDSYEAGHMNWTLNMPQEFQKRRGYGLLKYLPVLTGRVVNGLDESEKFLWDFRKTIGEMIAENHYDVIGEELAKRGMKRYTESHEGGRIYLADGMDVKRNADIPMAAMWTPGSLVPGTDEEVRSEADIREAASVAHIYGKPFVAAESMTSVGKPFQEYPEKLKRTADIELASGLNRFVIHTSVHQPLDKSPGFSLGPFGQYFSRLETWSGAGAKAWMDYLGRSSHLLQQGRNVADILYLYGENTNITWISRKSLPNIPKGFEFDFVNSSALINAIQPKNGQLLAQSGNTYKVLMLDESTKMMTLSVLKKIKTLVDAGVKIVGAKPVKSPSLADNDAEFQNLATEIWKSNHITSVEKLNFQPDLKISGTTNKVLFRHRNTGFNSAQLNQASSNQSTDIYWLNNRSDSPTTAEVSFRVTGKIPELWNAQTGKTEKLSYQIKDGRTIVPLKFESWDAYFVVFREIAAAQSYEKPKTIETLLTTINKPWKVSFSNQSAIFDRLTSWHENSDANVKYFSGTATYENSFNFDIKALDIDRSRSVMLDLGEVKNIAEVFVNGQNMGTVWKKPFKVDIGSALKAGENKIKIDVTNTWVNRLIGDAQPNAIKTTFTTMPFYGANSPLEPAGLLGEVKVIGVK